MSGTNDPASLPNVRITPADKRDSKPTFPAIPTQTDAEQPLINSEVDPDILRAQLDFISSGAPLSKKFAEESYDALTAVQDECADDIDELCPDKTVANSVLFFTFDFDSLNQALFGSIGPSIAVDSTFAFPLGRRLLSSPGSTSLLVRPLDTVRWVASMYGRQLRAAPSTPSGAKLVRAPSATDAHRAPPSVTVDSPKLRRAEESGRSKVQADPPHRRLLAPVAELTRAAPREGKSASAMVAVKPEAPRDPRDALGRGFFQRPADPDSDSDSDDEDESEDEGKHRPHHGPPPGPPRGPRPPPPGTESLPPHPPRPSTYQYSLGFGSERDACLLARLPTASPSCRASISSLYQLQAQYQAQSPPPPPPGPGPHHFPFFGAALVLLGVGLVARRVYWGRHRKFRRQQMNALINAVESNPSLKAAVEAELGTPLPQPLPESCCARKRCVLVRVLAGVAIAFVSVVATCHVVAATERPDEETGEPRPMPLLLALLVLLAFFVAQVLALKVLLRFCGHRESEETPSEGTDRGSASPATRAAQYTRAWLAQAWSPAPRAVHEGALYAPLAGGEFELRPSAPSAPTVVQHGTVFVPVPARPAASMTLI